MSKKQEYFVNANKSIFSKLRNHFEVDRFGIPKTMMNKARKQQQKKKIEEDILKEVRFTHMGFNQPPIKDESSDNDSIKNIKKLALIRTPYFLIPTIKINQIRRKDRLRKKYLKNYRLNRINILLYENRKMDSKYGNITRNMDLNLIKPDFLKVNQEKKDLALMCYSIGSNYRQVQRMEELEVSTICFLLWYKQKIKSANIFRFR